MATPAESTDLVRRRVINVVGHELRTPVTTVRGLVELLVDADPEEAREVIIPALLRNARRSEALLDDLLIVSDITTAHPAYEPSEVDLFDVVAKVTADTAVRVENRPDGTVHARPDLVERALGHLVANAEKYHTAPPSIRFESDHDRISVVVVTPVDEQVGDIDLTFEVFFRGEGAVTRSAGLGIGLPAARALARIDGGDVEVVSEPTDFIARLHLPRAIEGAS